jgi:alginate O-acetyltransferase complex protein AlgI
VWLLTGFWHGAGWSFMAWGVYFGVLLLGEKLLWGKALGRAPRVLRHAYVILIVLVSWTFFDAASFAGGFAVMRNLFAAPGGLVSAEGLYYLRSYAVPLLIAALGSTPLPKRLAERVSLPTGLEPAAVLAALTLVTAYLVDGSFNPFIYFRF